MMQVWALLIRHRVEQRVMEFRNIVKKIDNLYGYDKNGHIVSTLNYLQLIYFLSGGNAGC